MVEIQKINIKGVDNEIVDFNARVKIEALEDGKQDKLTFDTTPTASSVNPVTSDGIFHAIESASGTQSDWAETDPTSLAYIKNKPTIPEVLQSDWNQTDTTKIDYIKNKPADYTPKPHKDTHAKGEIDEVALDATQIVTGMINSDRIPELDSSKISSLDAGKLTGTINNARLSGVQSALPDKTNVSVSNWVSDTTYADYPYKATIDYAGVTSNHLAMVIFGVEDATSGDYAPICKSDTDKVYIWSAVNTAITIPTISATKVL